MKVTLVLCLALFSLAVFLPPSNAIKVSNLVGKTFRFVSKNYPGYFMRHRSYQMWLDRSDSRPLYRADSSFKIVPGLIGHGTVSFESKNFPGHYIRHSGYLCYIHKSDGSTLFKKDVSWIPVPGLADPLGYTFESFNYRKCYMRHQGYRVKISSFQNTDLYKNDATWYPVPIQVMLESADSEELPMEEYNPTNEEEAQPIENEKPMENFPVEEDAPAHLY
uniref:Alpha-L-arabinofuranosidase B arabinose-binding domain-containing protein n=1 Tax=Amphimedon queenslandica TaxID=400682 RepID=A0A1X7VP64_AMPQE